MAAWGIGKWSTHRAKVADARARLEAEDQLRSAHLVDFPTATRTVLPEPHRAITHLLRGGREKHEEAHREWLVQQAEADAAWHRTINHDPLHIIGEINDVFSKSAFPAVCVDAGTEDDKPYVTLVVTIPGHEVVIREPRQKGVPLHQRSDREIADIYNEMVGATIVATAKRAFAHAPAAVEARLVVVRWDSAIFSRKHKLGVIYSGTFTRAVCEVDWSSISPAEWIASIPDARIDSSSRRPLRVLSSRKHPELAGLLADIEQVVTSTAPA